MKPGWKTTEFGLVVLLFLVMIANKPLGLGLDSGELLGLAIGVAGYGGGRGLAKVTQG